MSSERVNERIDPTIDAVFSYQTVLDRQQTQASRKIEAMSRRIHTICANSSEGRSINREWLSFEAMSRIGFVL
jgi:hypothetical protein